MISLGKDPTALPCEMTKLFFTISTLTAVSSACVICMLVHLKGETISTSILGYDGTYLEIYYLDTFNLFVT